MPPPVADHLTNFIESCRLADRIQSVVDRTANVVDRIHFVVDRTANVADRIHFVVDRTANVADRFESVGDRQALPLKKASQGWHNLSLEAEESDLYTGYSSRRQTNRKKE